MTLTIYPTKLRGAVTPPPSKSQAHRLLIAAALAEGDSLIQNVAHSQDIDATLRCLTELGAAFEETANGLLVRGMGANAMSPLGRMALPRLDCGESGSTLRFLIPVALAVRGGGVFTGRGRLMERPQGPYFDIFKEKGIFFEQTDGVLTIQGSLTPGAYRLPGNVSSQFFTGLLYALPLLSGPSAILPTTREVESPGYIAMTLRAMEQFGVRTAATMSLPPQYHVFGSQTYRPARVAVEADWSHAGFWYAAQAMGSDVEVCGMDRRSLQGDRVFTDWMGLLEAASPVPGGGPDSAFTRIDVSGSPDLVPPLAAMAAVARGTLSIENAARLRIKESDRLSAVAEVLNALGGSVTEELDALTIRGVERLRGGVTVDAHNDHRIAMMTAIAATACERPVTLTGAESVAKSYPDFWAEYARLGGRIEEV